MPSLTWIDKTHLAEENNIQVQLLLTEFLLTASVNRNTILF